MPCSVDPALIEDKHFVEKGEQSTFAVTHHRAAVDPVDTAACFGFGWALVGSSLEW